MATNRNKEAKQMGKVEVERKEKTNNLVKVANA